MNIQLLSPTEIAKAIGEKKSTDLIGDIDNISISSLSDIDVVNITQKLLKFDSVVYLSAKKFFCLYYNVVEENGYSTMNLCVELFKDGALYLRRETNEQHYW